MDGMGGWEQQGGDGEPGIINQSVLTRVGGWGERGMAGSGHRRQDKEASGGGQEDETDPREAETTPLRNAQGQYGQRAPCEAGGGTKQMRPSSQGLDPSGGCGPFCPLSGALRTGGVPWQCWGWIPLKATAGDISVGSNTAQLWTDPFNLAHTVSKAA